MPERGRALTRRNVRELLRGPSHLYQRLLLGEINATEYVRVLRRAVDMRRGVRP